MSRSPAAPYDVKGRTVFITGAARGIGAAIAERLHARGANVALVGLEPELLEQTPEQTTSVPVRWQEVPELLATRFGLAGFALDAEDRIALAAA